jgi:hypothetical protein
MEGCEEVPVERGRAEATRERAHATQDSHATTPRFDSQPSPPPPPHATQDSHTTKCCTSPFSPSFSPCFARTHTPQQPPCVARPSHHHATTLSRVTNSPLSHQHCVCPVATDGQHSSNSVGRWGARAATDLGASAAPPSAGVGRSTNSGHVPGSGAAGTSSGSGSSGGSRFHGPSLAPLDLGASPAHGSASTGGVGVGSASCTTASCASSVGPGGRAVDQTADAPVRRGDGVFSGLACIVNPLVLLTTAETKTLPPPPDHEAIGEMWAMDPPTLSARTSTLWWGTVALCHWVQGAWLLLPCGCSGVPSVGVPTPLKGQAGRCST